MSIKKFFGQFGKFASRFSSRQILTAAAVIFLITSAVLSTLAFITFRNLKLGNTDVDLDHFVPGSQVGMERNFAAPDADSLAEIPSPKWDGSTRITILVMGVDYRDWNAGNSASRTDTMILLTIDPVTKTAGMLSIPRDLWVSIPGFAPQKINTAHYLGQLYNYPGGGPALAMETVENTLGIPIDYYARVDFYTFIRFIDLIGGVKVEVMKPIELEVIGKAYDVKLEPGTYALSGDAALAYARNRYTGGGDFERSQRQQQIVMGIRQRLLEPKIFALLIENATKLYDEFKSGIFTNLSFEDAVELAYLAIQIKQEDITMAVIGPGDYTFGASPDNLSIAIPIPDKMREKRDLVFSSGGAFSPMMTGEALILMQIEYASISILNGSNNPALGDQTAEYFRQLGANVVSVGQAPASYSRSAITDYRGRPYTLAYFVSLTKISPPFIYHRFDPNGAFEIEIILGNDWNANNSIP